MEEKRIILKISTKKQEKNVAFNFFGFSVLQNKKIYKIKAIHFYVKKFLHYDVSFEKS